MVQEFEQPVQNRCVILWFTLILFEDLCHPIAIKLKRI